MAKCTACHQELPQASSGTHAPAPQREFVPIKAQDKFAGLCRELAKMPNADARNIASLEDLPKTVARYKQLTVGQWKMFCAIHKQITDTWPPNKEEFLKEDPVQVFSDLPEEEGIPF